MATKNMARSAVEGGRAGRGSDRNETRKERRRARTFVRFLDPDTAAPPRRVDGWCSGLTDKLAPLDRYLQKNAGRPWDKVYSELCQRFDRRTLKGHHLLSGHVDRYTVRGHGHHSRPHEAGPPELGGAWIDRHGILRYKQRRRWRVNAVKK